MNAEIAPQKSRPAKASLWCGGVAIVSGVAALLTAFYPLLLLLLLGSILAIAFGIGGFIAVGRSTHITGAGFAAGGTALGFLAILPGLLLPFT
jgi:hypothetical protein